MIRGVKEHVHSAGTGYLAGCAGCQAKGRAATRKWQTANPEKHRAAVKAWGAKNPEKQRATQRAARAKQLARGERIVQAAIHHVAMAALKSQRGDPRPPGLTLSLVRWDSPHAYDGYGYSKGKRVPYRLSTDPDDYIWETQAENNARDRARRAREKPLNS